MPLHMRIPKRGFNNNFAKDYAEVNLGAIQKAIDNGKLTATDIDQTVLNATGLTRGGKDGVRLLAKGEIRARLNFTVAGASKSAREAVEKAGGTITIPVSVPAAEKHKAKHRSKLKIERKGKPARNAIEAPYTPVGLGKLAPFESVKPWLQHWRNATPDTLIALRNRLDPDHGTSTRIRTLEAIHETGELLRAAMSEPSISSREAATPRDVEKGAEMRTLSHMLHQRLLDPDSEVAGQAAIALAMSCASGRSLLPNVPMGSKLEPEQLAAIAGWLADMLHRAGDQSYSTVFLLDKQDQAQETLLRCGFRLSRALPFTLSGIRIVLPAGELPGVSPDMVHILGPDDLPPVELKSELPAEGDASDEALLFACTFLVHLPRPFEHQVQLSLAVGNLASQRYTITPKDVAALPAT